MVCSIYCLTRRVYDCCQTSDAVRRRKLRVVRQSEAVRRDDALRTTRQRLRLTDNWSVIDDRRRRAFERLCDDVRRERLDAVQTSSSSVESDASFPRRCVDQTRTECTAAVPRTSSSSPTATSATATSVDERTTSAESTDVVSPLSVTLHVVATSNSSSETVAATAALCVTTATTTCVQVTSLSRQFYATASSSTADRRRVARPAASKLPSPSLRGRVTLDELPAEIPTTNGVVDDNDDDDDGSAVVPGPTSIARVRPVNVDDSRNLVDTSNCIESSLASGGVPPPPPPLKSFGNSNRTDEDDGVRRVDSCTRGDVGGVKENVPPAKSAVNSGDGVAQPARLRPASATHPHLTANQRAGWSSKGVVVVARNDAAARPVVRVPPPVPTRTSSVLSGGGGAAARSNGHLFRPRATPATAPRSMSVPPQSTISLSRRSAFRRDKSSVTGSLAEITTETEIL